MLFPLSGLPFRRGVGCKQLNPHPGVHTAVSRGKPALFIDAYPWENSLKISADFCSHVEFLAAFYFHELEIRKCRANTAMNGYCAVTYNESQRCIIPATTGFMQLVSFCMPCHLVNKLLFSAKEKEEKEKKKKDMQISLFGAWKMSVCICIVVAHPHLRT